MPTNADDPDDPNTEITSTTTMPTTPNDPNPEVANQMKNLLEFFISSNKTMMSEIEKRYHKSDQIRQEKAEQVRRDEVSQRKTDRRNDLLRQEKDEQLRRDEAAKAEQLRREEAALRETDRLDEQARLKEATERKDNDCDAMIQTLNDYRKEERQADQLRLEKSEQLRLEEFNQREKNRQQEQIRIEEATKRKDKERDILIKAMDDLRKEESDKREAARVMSELAMQTRIQNIADNQAAQVQFLASATPTPAAAPLSSNVGLMSVAASTTQILDVSRTSPPSHCWIIHQNNVINVKLRHVHWDDGKPTYEVEPIGRYKGCISLEVDEFDIWPFDDTIGVGSSGKKNNEDNHVKLFHVDISASPYTPYMTVK